MKSTTVDSYNSYISYQIRIQNILYREYSLFFHVGEMWCKLAWYVCSLRHKRELAAAAF